ncbi:MAG: S-CspCI protein [Lachnospiraceae bacterium]|nr:S-CspCI protein [Lachnospiraceae bacterium]
MKISDLFVLHQGNGFELYNMNLSVTSNINFISRTAQNNGVVAKVCRDEAKDPFPAGYITVALGGSVLSSFVQICPFYTAYHIMVLEPKKEMSFNEKLFYCMCIQKNAYRYSYGRQANKTLKDIMLPENVPQWVKESKMQPISTRYSYKKNELNIQTWNNYSLDYLFDFVKGKRLTKADMLPGNVNFLGAISENNGIREKIATSQYCKPNCITVNYNGSVGEAFYQKDPFWASDDVNVLYAKDFWELNQYTAMFIITVIKANKYRFGYGRKWTLEKMKDTMIKLPSKKDGMPDFEYMVK